MSILMTEPAANSYELWMSVTNRIIHGDYDQLQGACIFHYNNALWAKTTEFDLDLRKVGLLDPRGRWTRFLNQYVIPAELQGFLEKCEALDYEKSSRTTVLFARTTGGHNWGNCLIAATFRARYRHEPPTLALYSRTSRFPNTAALDLTFANVLARHICEITSLSIEEIEFRWYGDSFFVSAIWVIPYLIESGEWDKFKEMAERGDQSTPEGAKFYKALPAQYKLITRFIQRMDVEPEELVHLKYGQALRAGKSLHRLLGREEERKNVTHFKPEHLDFTPLGLELREG